MELTRKNKGRKKNTIVLGTKYLPITSNTHTIDESEHTENDKHENVTEELFKSSPKCPLNMNVPI